MMRIKLRPVPVTPVGKAKALAFFTRETGCLLEEVESPVYPPSVHGERLRHLRLHDGKYLMLGEAARLLEIDATTLSGLETGRLALTAAEWDEAKRVLAKHARGA